MHNKPIYPTGVLFDFDGVVVDSFRSHFNAWNVAHKALFSKEITHFPHEKLSGKSPHIIAQHFCDEAGYPTMSKELFTKKGELLHSSTTPPDLLPGVREIEKYLKENKIPYGIASNATRGFVKNSVRHLNLGFTTCLGLEDYQKPKPAPEAYITLANALNIEKQHYKSTWVFEDSITGTQAAVKAGMLPIGILTMNTEAKMLAAGSVYCFPTLLEAFEFLNKAY